MFHVELEAERYFSSDEVVRQLADADIDDAEAMLRAGLAEIDPALTITSLGEKPRGVVREIELSWRCGRGEEHRRVIPLPAVAA